jgi:hypothetical protein
MGKTNATNFEARRNPAMVAVSLVVMVSLCAAVFFSVMEIEAKRLGSWEAAIAYPRPFIVLNNSGRSAK